jgi:hypothetical protein
VLYCCVRKREWYFVSILWERNENFVHPREAVGEKKRKKISLLQQELERVARGINVSFSLSLSLSFERDERGDAFSFPVFVFLFAVNAPFWYHFVDPETREKWDPKSTSTAPPRV